METEQLTLRSQTKQCPYCKEYYSVTYKYCPFCDEERKVEERKAEERRNAKRARRAVQPKEPERTAPPPVAERRQRERQAPPVAERRQRERQAPPVAERRQRERQAPPVAEHRQIEREEIPVEITRPNQKTEAVNTQVTTKKGGLWRKTSELSEEEKAIRLREREARAAERKRIRDQKARAAAAAAAAEAAKKTPTPVFEVPSVPETFGFEGDLAAQIDPSILAGAPISQAEPVILQVSSVEEGVQTITNVTPTQPAQASEPTQADTQVSSAPQTSEKQTPSAEAEQDAEELTASTRISALPPEDEAERSRWEFLRALETFPTDTILEVEAEGAVETLPQTNQMPTQPQPTVSVPPQPQPVIQQQPTQVAESAITPQSPAPQTFVSVQPIVQETPVVETEQKPIETDADLDALLNEVRGILASSPVPEIDLNAPAAPAEPMQPEPVVTEPTPVAAEPPQIAEPAPAMVETVPPEPVVTEPLPVEPAEAVASESKIEEWVPMEDLFPVEEPTRVIPAKEVEEAMERLETEDASAVVEEPTRVLPTEEIAAALDTAPELLPVKKKKRKPDPAPKAEEKAPKKRKKQGHGRTWLAVILSLVIIVAAVFIIGKKVLPVFQNGILGGGQSTQQPKDDTVENLSLDQTDVTLDKKDATLTLKPVLAPEGSVATLTWKSDNEKVATVDQNGVVTPVAPGKATISATSKNGKTAECVVRCTWTDETAPAEAKVAISQTEMTIDGEGKTKTLTVTGTTEPVKWSTSKKEVATVAEDGTVTAVAKGRATVTATIGEEKYNCEIRCIW